MPRFEVHIPAAETTGFNVTFRVDAANWMAALKTGMQKLGEQGSAVQNILVDIQDDNSVHVTESASGRVFRIRELTDAEAASAQVKKSPTLPPTPASALPRVPDAQRTQPGGPLHGGGPAQAPDARRTLPGVPLHASEAATLAGRPPLQAERTPSTEPLDVSDELPPPAKTVPSMPAPAPGPAPAPAPAAPAAPAVAKARPAVPPPAPAPPTPPPPARRRPNKQSEADEVVELEAPTRPISGPIGRPAKKNRKEEIEDMLAEVFERVQEVYARADPEAALYFLLDLALEKIPAESGTVFFADGISGDLTFRAVRGPRAEELLSSKMVIPSGTGIVGFCAIEGVAVAISDVERDPRFFSRIAEKVNYVPRSILCAPMMTHGRTFGCLQILNKKADARFNEVEIGLISYIAHQGALFLNSR